MNTAVDINTNGPSITKKTKANGPVANARIKRFNLGYGVMCLLGLVPTLLGWNESLQAFGLGLWFPGAGFIAVGGWAMLATLLCFLLFGVAFVAWFGSGMIVAPVIVWLGAAIVAGMSTGETLWPNSYWLVPALTAVMIAGLMLRARIDFKQQTAKQAERNAYLPDAYRAMRTAQTQQPEQMKHELSTVQLEHLRWVLDRALQPIGELNGFTKIDQFQIAALRYQLNFIGYTLAMTQRHYTPNFRGYMSESQRRVIEQSLQPQICNYWRLESAWGNLSLDADPVGKDNIMLTGYFGLQVCLYMNNTGDYRYEEPGSLTFKVSDKQQFPHNVHSINQSLLDNFERDYNDFCLYPCEPNWVYSACNLFGASALTAYDIAYDTNHFSQLKNQFVDKFETEFVNASGSIVPLRSQLTGHALPFPAPDGANVVLANPALPDIAARYWTISRYEWIVEENGKTKINIDIPAIDYGNYTKNNFFVLEGLLGAAVEFGDEVAAKSIQEVIDEQHTVNCEEGRRYYSASTLANISYTRTILGFKNAWRDTVSKPMPETGLKGPLLQEVNYPGTIVARAVSDGSNLEMVLVATGEETAHQLSFDQLTPNKSYRLTGEGIAETVVADDKGIANIEIPAIGRQKVELSLQQ